VNHDAIRAAAAEVAYPEPRHEERIARHYRERYYAEKGKTSLRCESLPDSTTALIKAILIKIHDSLAVSV
jgi:hypothetical protein